MKDPINKIQVRLEGKRTEQCTKARQGLGPPSRREIEELNEPPSLPQTEMKVLEYPIRCMIDEHEAEAHLQTEGLTVCKHHGPPVMVAIPLCKSDSGCTLLSTEKEAALRIRSAG